MLLVMNLIYSASLSSLLPMEETAVYVAISVEKLNYPYTFIQEMKGSCEETLSCVEGKCV